MCDNPGQFSELSKTNVSITVGGNIPVQVTGKGIVKLNCALPHGQGRVVTLQEVLYVPTRSYLGSLFGVLEFIEAEM